MIKAIRASSLKQISNASRASGAAATATAASAVSVRAALSAETMPLTAAIKPPLLLMIHCQINL